MLPRGLRRSLRPAHGRRRQSHGLQSLLVLTVPADDLDYVAHDSALELIVAKIHEKLSGKEEVIFEEEEVAKVNGRGSRSQAPRTP